MMSDASKTWLTSRRRAQIIAAHKSGDIAQQPRTAFNPHNRGTVIVRAWAGQTNAGDDLLDRLNVDYERAIDAVVQERYDVPTWSHIATEADRLAALDLVAKVPSVEDVIAGVLIECSQVAA